MPARRCPVHGLDFPAGVTACPVCGESTTWQQTAAPDADWEAQVHQLQLMRAARAPDVDAWRLKQFLDLGCSVAQAETLAASCVDYHAVRALTDRGCPIGTAIAIVS